MSARLPSARISSNRFNFASASGQALPLIVVVLALAAVSAFLLASLGGEVLRSARSQAAADTSALAGAASGERAARRVAERNGAELVSFAQKDALQSVGVARRPVAPASPAASGVEVEVRRDGWDSSAAAALGSLRPLSRSAERRFPSRLPVPLPASAARPSGVLAKHY